MRAYLSTGLVLLLAAAVQAQTVQPVVPAPATAPAVGAAVVTPPIAGRAAAAVAVPATAVPATAAVPAAPAVPAVNGPYTAAPAGVVMTPPANYRMQYHNGNWWYYGPTNNWTYWSGTQWVNPAPAAAAVTTPQVQTGAITPGQERRLERRAIRATTP